MNLIKKIIKFLSKPRENYPNWLILKYHILKAIDKIKTGNKNAVKKDMFNWKLYNLHFRGELKALKKEYTLDLKKEDYVIKNGELVQKNKKIKPLHPNWRLLYETILQLKPDSVLEMGCGNGMHLNNINTLSPEVKLRGIDLLKEQIDFLWESYPNIKADIKQADITEKLSEELMTKSDIVFTQAVIQHIHEDNKHIHALANIFNLSKKYVILVERWRNHDFMVDIKKLFDDKKINWDNLFFYYKESPELKRPHIMICSNQKLDFPVLNDYKILNYEKKNN